MLSAVNAVWPPATTQRLLQLSRPSPQNATLVPLARLGPGDQFGELVALLGGERRATVRALTPLNLLELTRQDLESVMQESPSLRRQIQQSIHPRVVGRALLHCDELTPLPPQLRDELAQAFVLERRQAGETVVKPGQPERLTCLAEGTLRIGDRILNEGSVLGMGALHDARAVQAVQALQPVSLLVLPGDLPLLSIEPPLLRKIAR